MAWVPCTPKVSALIWDGTNFEEFQALNPVLILNEDGTIRVPAGPGPEVAIRQGGGYVQAPGATRQYLTAEDMARDYDLS